MNKKSSVALATRDVIESIPCESMAWNFGVEKRTTMTVTNVLTGEDMQMKPKLGHIAELVNYDAGNFSRFVDGQIGTPLNRAAAIMRAIGNAIPLQYIAYELGLELQPAGYVEKLQHELEELRLMVKIKTPEPQDIWATPVPN